MTPDEMLSRILYRDGLMLIINKPAGLPVHAGPRGGDNLEQFFDVLRFGLPNPPALAHRLDRDTSGCLILGRHRKALRKLGNLFTHGQIHKTYWAIVKGAPPELEGTVDLPLSKKSRDKRSWWMKVDREEGMPSVTDYKVLGQADGLSWLEMKPRTGRTHQIRVHCAALGCPILGDPVYGKGEEDDKNTPLQLHARAIEVPLYPKRDPIIAEAPPPPHIEENLRRFRK